jgi:16S rRNA (guanine966-N2)-methyltransferase
MKISSRNTAEMTYIVDKLARSASPKFAPANPASPGKAPAKKTVLSTLRPPQAAGEVRIIGGLWKRTKLAVVNHPGLRPTPDRVRETLFNWLGQDMSGLRCVDAFAGTGALGLEAASRGALDVLLIESETRLINQLTSLKTKLKADAVRIQRGDGIAILQALPAGSVDVVFIDPPFEAPIFDKALAAAAHAVSSQGAVYLEAPKLWTDAELAVLGLAVTRSGKAGVVHYHLLSKI